ncbi:sugar ABC transporter substrate-binding protein [Nocardioides sp. SOB77]|uniref:Sugar ABC transporter substrate-binding protein n=1 Tax=Nocardioides oceani TaxID=3058369 RepID=A0ABT8FD60_9ACTN|nr:sugar ABC transporter substrate-binding protein [Nocardioides oceani]MDN4172350.1 sugar ABC transporter substrate-binding protein [Nocardioides oceani]
MTFPRQARWSHRLFGTTAGLALFVAVGACSTETGSGATAAADDDVARAAVQALEESFYDQGSYSEPPSTGPTAQEGYRIAVVNAGVQSPSGTKQVNAAREVAELLDWELSVFDGEYEPSAYQEGIRRAITQGADVIWLYSIDCPLVKTALVEARRAGIPVVSQESADCNEVDPADKSYFAESLQFSEGSFIDWGKALGAAQATWLLAKLGQDADIIEVSVPDLVVLQALHDGFTEVMNERCPDCKVTTVEAQIADLGPTLQEKSETALLRNPSANGMAVSYDDLMTAGGSAAVMASGRNSSIEVVAGTGFPANVELVRDDQGQDAGFAYDMGFETWAAADMVNRLLAGQKQDPAGSDVGVAVYDRESGLPTEGSDWTTDIDYKSVYKKVWGVS